MGLHDAKKIYTSSLPRSNYQTLNRHLPLQHLGELLEELPASVPRSKLTFRGPSRSAMCQERILLRSYVLINREQGSQLLKGVSCQKLSPTIAATGFLSVCTLSYSCFSKKLFIIIISNLMNLA